MKRRLLISLASILALPAAAWGQELHEVSSPYPYPGAAWSPYLAGGLIGVLTMLTLTFSKKPVGASERLCRFGGLAGRHGAPERIASLKYFQEHKPALSWTLLFVIGTVGGAFLAAWSGGELNGAYLQNLWIAHFGPDSYLLRTLTAFVGGAVMAYGARLAGGCTSGHGISGTLQLAVGSWVAVVCFFVGGVATAMLLYRV